MLNYHLLNPTGNITALVVDKCNINRQPDEALKIMEVEPSCEQVGFISNESEDSDISLRMAGGEFCGNATMCAASYYAFSSNLSDNETSRIKVNVSGTEKPVYVTLNKIGNLCECAVTMPLPDKISEHSFIFNDNSYTYPAVFFPGIVHVVINTPFDKKTSEEMIKKWCHDINSDAMGLMFFDEKTNTLNPLVYVKSANTLFWESSCASGTTAVGAYYYSIHKKGISLSINEPAGILKIESDDNGILTLFGKVEWIK